MASVAMTGVARWAAVALTVALTACSLAPPLKTPAVPAAENYKETGPWTQAAPADRLPRDSWWTLYGSTELNDLDQQAGPNLTGIRPGSVSLLNTPALQENLIFDGFGGDRIGALLLSPFVKPGSTSDTQYNHYSLLRSLENIFGLREHLGYAADDPATNYHLHTIGNDRQVFEHAPEPWLNHNWWEPHF